MQQYVLQNATTPNYSEARANHMKSEEKERPGCSDNLNTKTPEWKENLTCNNTH